MPDLIARWPRFHRVARLTSRRVRRRLEADRALVPEEPDRAPTRGRALSAQLHSCPRRGRAAVYRDPREENTRTLAPAISLVGGRRRLVWGAAPGARLPPRGLSSVTHCVSPRTSSLDRSFPGTGENRSRIHSPALLQVPAGASTLALTVADESRLQKLSIEGFTPLLSKLAAIRAGDPAISGLLDEPRRRPR